MRLEEALAVLDPCRGEACLAPSAPGLPGPWGDLDEAILLLSLEGPEGRCPQDLRRGLERLAGAQHRLESLVARWVAELDRVQPEEEAVVGDARALRITVATGGSVIVDSCKGRSRARPMSWPLWLGHTE
jgi:hypothetical protein